MLKLRCQGPVSRKSRKLLGPEKPFLKLRLAHSVKLVFSYVVKRRKIKITAKFRILRRLRFEDTKRTVTRNAPEKFRDFRETGQGLYTVNNPFQTKTVSKLVLFFRRFRDRTCLGRD